MPPTALLFEPLWISRHLVFSSYGLLNISLQIFFAVGQPLPWRPRLKTLLAMTARADEHTRQRIRTCETNMRALRTKDRDESHLNDPRWRVHDKVQITTYQTRSQRKFGEWLSLAK